VELGQLDLRYMGVRAADARREARLLSSLSERGQLSPVVLVPSHESERFVLIDGYKRVRALEKLRNDVVEATVWKWQRQRRCSLSAGCGCRRRVAARSKKRGSSSSSAIALRWTRSSWHGGSIGARAG
jgi:ParB-like nuclease domain